jgi:hypothetical protein
MLADFLGLNIVNLYNLASTNSDEGPRRHVYGRRVLCRNTLMVIACSKKKFLVSTAKPLAQTFLRHRLAANLTRLSKNLPSHQPIRLCLHTPHVLDHSLRFLFETALITHYLNFMLIDFLSAA